MSSSNTIKTFSVRSVLSPNELFQLSVEIPQGSTEDEITGICLIKLGRMVKFEEVK